MTFDPFSIAPPPAPRRKTRPPVVVDFNAIFSKPPPPPPPPPVEKKPVSIFIPEVVTKHPDVDVSVEELVPPPVDVSDVTVDEAIVDVVEDIAPIDPIVTDGPVFIPQIAVDKIKEIQTKPDPTPVELDTKRQVSKVVDTFTPPPPPPPTPTQIFVPEVVLQHPDVIVTDPAELLPPPVDATKEVVDPRAVEEHIFDPKVGRFVPVSIFVPEVVLEHPDVIVTDPAELAKPPVDVSKVTVEEAIVDIVEEIAPIDPIVTDGPVFVPEVAVKEIQRLEKKKDKTPAELDELREVKDVVDDLDDLANPPDDDDGGDALEIFLPEVILKHPDVKLTDPAELVPNPEDSKAILDAARDAADQDGDGTDDGDTDLLLALINALGNRDDDGTETITVEGDEGVVVEGTVVNAGDVTVEAAEAPEVTVNVTGASPGGGGGGGEGGNNMWLLAAAAIAAVVAKG